MFLKNNYIGYRKLGKYYKYTEKLIEIVEIYFQWGKLWYYIKYNMDFCRLVLIEIGPKDQSRKRCFDECKVYKPVLDGY